MAATKGARRKLIPTPEASTRERAYNFVREKILTGELPAGSPISESLIARELGISRTPLREAIHQLGAEGFLRQLPNRRSEVVEFSKQDIRELYELREALEVYTVGRAAQQGIRPADLEALESRVEDILELRRELEQSGSAMLNASQMRRFVQFDLNFHALLVRSAGNRRILKTFADTRVLLSIFAMRRKGHSVVQLNNIYRYHADVLKAVKRGDAEAAMDLLREHIRISRQERLDEYEEWTHEQALDRAMASI